MLCLMRLAYLFVCLVTVVILMSRTADSADLEYPDFGDEWIDNPCPKGACTPLTRTQKPSTKPTPKQTPKPTKPTTTAKASTSKPRDGHRRSCTRSETRVAACLNGGKCFALILSTRIVQCHCPEMWIGRRCEEAHDGYFVISAGMIAAIAVSAVAVVVVVTIIIAYVLIKRHRRRNNRYPGCLEKICLKKSNRKDPEERQVAGKLLDKDHVNGTEVEQGAIPLSDCGKNKQNGNK